MILASTVAAAVAALVACAAVGLDLWRDRKSHVPHVSAMAGRPTDGSGPALAFANAGPGVAIALVYFGVDGEYQFGNGVGPGGHLMPFAETTDKVALAEWTAKRPSFIYSCRDINGGLHVWAADGRYDYSRPEIGAWPSAGDNFRKMYPGVPIPDTPYDPPPLVRWG